MSALLPSGTWFHTPVYGSISARIRFPSGFGVTRLIATLPRTTNRPADCRLMTAAPELLAALRLARDEVHHPGAARNSGIDIEAVMSAAIAKATGGVP
jgi:hypothetical protein